MNELVPLTLPYGLKHKFSDTDAAMFSGAKAPVTTQ